MKNNFPIAGSRAYLEMLNQAYVDMMNDKRKASEYETTRGKQRLTRAIALMGNRYGVNGK